MTTSDWNTILLSKNPIFPQKYVRSCSDEKGSEKDSISIIAYPVYECPPGSRRSDGQYGCSTTPKVCNADVVGRDMKSDYKIIQSLGHVGLTMTSDDQDILEVLNTERPALHTNTFYSFSHNPSALFWGEVFAPISDIQITNEQASKIVFAGMEQGAYSPEYSYLPLAFPGRLINLYIFNPETLSFLKEPSSVPGFFRCDTFVAYAYKEGAGVNLGSYAFLTPNKIYNEFTQKRDAFPTPISKIFPRLNLPNPTLDSCTTALCYEEELDTLLASEEIDVDNLHAVIQSYIQTTDDPELSNLYLYKQAQKYQDDPSRHDFLIQELGQQKPLALVSNFVEDYQQQAAVKNYDELYAIVRSLQITNEEDIKKLTPAQIESFKKAQALFINILKTSNDVDEVNLALGLADNILPPEEVMELAQEVSERLYLKSSTKRLLHDFMTCPLAGGPAV